MKRRRMPRLVESKGDAARDRDRRDAPPTLIRDWAGFDTLRLQLDERSIDVVAHEIQLVRLMILRMNPKLRRRQREDEPSAARVDVRGVEDVAKKRADGVGVLRIDERVHSGDHRGGSRLERGPSFCTRSGRGSSPADALPLSDQVNGFTIPCVTRGRYDL